MTNFRYAFIIFIFLSSCVQSDAQIKSDLDKLKLKGKVKSIIIQDFLIKENGEFYDSTGWSNIHLDPDTTKLFNESGNLTKIVRHLGLSGRTEDKIYTYNPKGQCIKMEYNEHGYPFHYLERYRYNSKGFLIEMIRVDDSDYNGNKNIDSVQTTYTEYDKNGNLLREDHKNLISGGKSYCIFTYDNGKLMKQECFYGPKNEPWELFTYEYDQYGNVICMKTAYPGQRQLSADNYCKFDANGLLIEEYELEQGSSTPTDIKKYTYIFDDQGNWIERTKLNEDGSKKIVKRKIEYW